MKANKIASSAENSLRINVARSRDQLASLKSDENIDCATSAATIPYAIREKQTPYGFHTLSAFRLLMWSTIFPSSCFPL